MQKLLKIVLSLYAIALVVNLAIPFLTARRTPWMTKLAAICEPGRRLGQKIVNRLFPSLSTQLDVGSLAAVVLCWLATIVIDIF